MDDPLVRVPGAQVDAPSPPQRICSWCHTQIAPGSQPATYGICHRCFVELERDARRREDEGPG